ncbi:hypothetical protein [Weissella confusa]|uniref:hypothetical protein n=1 Tax=Weissella confusa TaxID=1583 RepID=UPI0018F1C127|nr:hypothetical protein [Weissella confusa]MBJ7681839.1 hypothetical protein [Weissella confusa]MBJ7684101.1 hypothetical protein [Weissella confusa]MBJ7702905.1 hypothetical protein [Weissella confusa]
MQDSKKTVWLLIVTAIGAAGVILVGWFGDSITDTFFQNLILDFSVVAAFVQFAYKKSAAVFIFWNKIISRFRQSTASWSSTRKYFVENFDINEEYENFKEILQSLGWTIIKRSKSDSEIIYEAKLNNLPRTFKIKISPKDGYTQVKFSSKSTIDSSAVIHEWNEFQKVFHSFEESMSVLRHSKLPEYEKPVFIVSISLNRFNPFYRLTLRKIDNAEKVDFKLSFESENVSVKIMPKQIELSSYDSQAISKSLADFVIVSSVG